MKSIKAIRLFMIGILVIIVLLDHEDLIQVKRDIIINNLTN